ncbi:unnamed protein product [Closterium sp. Naga37s-1]|nr:unnamed protein product [Closterium sp. Naga37s-1]
MFRSSPVSGGRYVSQVRPEPRVGKDGGSDIDEGDSVHDEASSLLRSDARPFPTSVGVAWGIFGGSYGGGSGGGFRKGNRRLRTLAACAALVVAALVLAACAVVDVADAWLGFGETRRAAGLERCVPQDIPGRCKGLGGERWGRVRNGGECWRNDSGGEEGGADAMLFSRLKNQLADAIVVEEEVGQTRQIDGLRIVRPFPCQCHRTAMPISLLRLNLPSLSEMTVEEKVGQMMQIDERALGYGGNITVYHIGSVLSGGGAWPQYAPNTPTAWADMVDNFQAKALNTRLRVPLLYGVDAVHGHNNVEGATIFPHHVGLGAAGNATLVEEIAAAVAKEVAATGVRWTFAPAVTVCLDPRWGRCYESYGADPGLVTELAIAEIRGWMAGNFPGSVFMAPTAKHYVGDGGTRGGVDRGETVGGEAELRKVHLLPYVAAVAEGVSSIMASYSSWNGTKMHGNGYLLTDVLRRELGFVGLMVSDWEALKELPGSYEDQVALGVNSGLDMIMVPNDFANFSATLSSLVNSGRVPMSRIDEAVSRVLSLKHSLEHRQLARKAVAASLVLLQDKWRRGGTGSGYNAAVWGRGRKKMLPLPVDGVKIVVAGSHANDIGRQCGGWTITWQGEEGPITKGTTIWQGIKELVAGRAASLTYIGYPPEDERYENGTRKRPLEATREAAAVWAKRARSVEADLGIIVVGEPPYAEYKGDDQQLELSGPARSTIFSICGQIPCVVVVVSGRPLNVTGMLPHLDALIAAWLPGSEGGGVADVLFDEAVDFKGKLPLPWFRSVRDLQLDHSPGPNPPLFPLGFGLSKTGELLGTRQGGEGAP